MDPPVGNATFFGLNEVSFHGLWWVSMVFKVFSWFFMVFGWLIWFFKVVLWFFMVFSWFPGFFKVVLRFLVGFHGFSRFPGGFSLMLMMLTMTMLTLIMMFNSRRAIKTLSVIWGMKQEHEDDIFDGHDGEDIHPDDIGFNQEVMETEMKRCDKSDKRENERETLSLGQFVSSWDGDAGTMSTSSHMTHTN